MEVQKSSCAKVQKYLSFMIFTGFAIALKTHKGKKSH